MTALTRRDALRTGAALAISPALFAGATNTAQAADDPYADAKFVDGAPAKPAQGAFTVAVLPDTQNYSDRFPETYAAQTKSELEALRRSVQRGAPYGGASWTWPAVEFLLRRL